ncbi:MAG TPA: metallophosphoesterase family protein [Deltaproteobacteria bacterium]|nr:metallophosphoesterase family protein [Deltaproteobacteria bacterium]HPR53822.1 metallophosphoesterase family protein [Deltaproteobacteria bacterium]HXK45978.1 metallophosphoesterase family protein [Deltaproteobacteria bacterium]
MNRTFAIGDIHGCPDKLEDLISAMDPQPEDRIVFLGDYVDRGEGVVEVIDALIGLAGRFDCIFLRGNHEDMFLSFLEFGNNKTVFYANGGLRTVESYARPDSYVSADQIARRMPDAHRDFFSHLRWYHEDENYIYAHAGLKPGVPVAEQDRHDLIWIRDEFISTPTGIPKKVIFGHTPFARPLVKTDKIGIDTGAVYGGCLTAVVLPEEKFIQSFR